MSNSLDPGHDRSTGGPDLGSNCLQRLPADDKKCCSETVEELFGMCVLYLLLLRRIDKNMATFKQL